MKSSAYLLLPVICLACLPINVPAISVELSPIADTSIFENAANKNSGKTSPLPVGKVASDKRTRLLLRFDVAGIPVGATIRSASLSIVVQRQFSPSAPALQLSVFRMKTDWIEGAQGLNDLSGGEAQPGEPTWSHRKFPNVPWGTAGGQPGTDFESEASAVMRVDSTGAKVITGFCGLADDVAAWVASPDQNHGWILSGLDGGGATSARRIASREDVSNSPKLIVEFDPPSPGGYEQILARFGRIHTIAGRGAVDSNGGNDWQETFEGGPARNAELSEAHNAQADAYGNVFIADKDSHAIRVVRRDGTIHRVAGTNASGNGSDDPQPGRQCALASPNGLHVLPSGVCYIYDTFNRKIRRLDPDGTIRTVFSDAGLGLVGRGLWVNEDGSLVYYANGGEVRVWTPAEGGRVLASGFSGGLANLTVDPQGRVVVTDRNAHSVFRIGSDGIPVRIAGNGTVTGGGDGQPALATGLEEVRGVTFVPSGGFFVGTHRGSDIWFIDNENVAHLFISGVRNSNPLLGEGQIASAPGNKLSEIRAVNLTPGGDLIITQSDESNVRIVENTLPSEVGVLSICLKGLPVVRWATGWEGGVVEETADVVAGPWTVARGWDAGRAAFELTGQRRHGFLRIQPGVRWVAP